MVVVLDPKNKITVEEQGIKSIKNEGVASVYFPTSYKGYEVKKVKQWRTLDGGGMTCELYLYGQKVLESIDDGNGGGQIIHYMNDTLQKQFEEFIEKEKAIREKEHNPENKVQLGFISSVDNKFVWDEEFFIDELINMHNARKYMMRDCKNSLVIQHDNQIETSNADLWKIKKEYKDFNSMDEKEKEHILKEYEKQGVKKILIVNDVFGIAPIPKVKDNEAIFKKNAKKYGLEGSDYGFEFELKGEKYKVIGVNPKKKLKPILLSKLSDTSDATYSCPADLVLHYKRIQQIKK